MSGKKDKKGHKSQVPAVMSPFMVMTPEMMSQWQAQMANMTNTPSTSTSMKAATVSKPPWTSDSSSSSDEDFQPSAKKPKFAMGKKVANSQKEVPQSQANKRKVGRPKKPETLERERTAQVIIADQKIVDNYPQVAALTNDTIAETTKEECKGCKIWKGVYAVLPCGHAKYCHYCMFKLKEEAQNMKRPSRCPCDYCYTIVTSWFKLFHISP